MRSRTDQIRFVFQPYSAVPPPTTPPLRDDRPLPVHYRRRSHAENGARTFEELKLKPAPTTVQLTRAALMEFPDYKATLQEIGAKIADHYPEYKSPAKMRKLLNNTRHRLTNSDWFKNTGEKPPGKTAKAKYWTYVEEWDRPPRERRSTSPASSVSPDSDESTSPWSTPSPIIAKASVAIVHPNSMEPPALSASSFNMLDAEVSPMSPPPTISSAPLQPAWMTSPVWDLTKVLESIAALDPCPVTTAPPQVFSTHSYHHTPPAVACGEDVPFGQTSSREAASPSGYALGQEINVTSEGLPPMSPMSVSLDEAARLIELMDAYTDNGDDGILGGGVLNFCDPYSLIKDAELDLYH